MNVQQTLCNIFHGSQIHKRSNFLWQEDGMENLEYMRSVDNLQLIINLETIRILNNNKPSISIKDRALIFRIRFWLLAGNQTGQNYI